MKTFGLKIICSVVMVVSFIAGVYVFWPAEALDAEHTGNQDKDTLKAQPDTMAPKANADPAPARLLSPKASEFEKRKAAQLRQTADSLITVYRHPNSPDAAKARESLLKLPVGLEMGEGGCFVIDELLSYIVGWIFFVSRSRIAYLV